MNIRTSFLHTALLGAGLILACAAANAAEGDVSGFGGLMHASNATKPLVGGSAGVNVASRLGIFGEFSYTQMKEQVPVTANIIDVTTKIVNFGGGVRAHFLDRDARVNPYGVGVFGAGHASSSLPSGYVWTSGQHSATQAYVGGGGGVSVYIGSNWGFRPEVRIQHYMSSTGSQVSGNLLLVTGGVFFNFGRN